MVDDAQMAAALAEQRQNGGRLGEILHRLKFLREEDVTTALAEYLRMPRWSLENLSNVNMEFAQSLPERLARRFRLVALGQKTEVIPRYLLGARLQVELNEFLDNRKRFEETTAELKPMFTSSAVSRYKNGLDSEYQLQDNLLTLGVSPAALPQYLIAARLDADLDEYTDYLAALKLSVQKGAIEPPDMTELLVKRGVRRERAELLAETEALKLLPKRAA